MLVGYALNTRKIISHKKGEACKARVNEWRSNKKIVALKDIKEVLNASVWRLFQKV